MSPHTSRPADANADNHGQQSLQASGERPSGGFDTSRQSAFLHSQTGGSNSDPPVTGATFQTSRQASSPQHRGSRNTRARRGRGFTGGVLRQPGSDYPVRPISAHNDTRNELSWRSQIPVQPLPSARPLSHSPVSDHPHLSSSSGGHAPYIGRQQAAVPDLTYGPPAAMFPALSQGLGQPLVTQTGHGTVNHPYGASAPQSTFIAGARPSPGPPLSHPSFHQLLPTMLDPPGSSNTSSMLGAPSQPSPYQYGAHTLGQSVPFTAASTTAGPRPYPARHSSWRPPKSGPPLPSSMQREKPQRSGPKARTARADTRGQLARSSTNVPFVGQEDAFSGVSKSDTGVRRHDPSGMSKHIDPHHLPEAPTVRSEHVMWVGNVPSSATQQSLSTFFSTGLDDVAHNRSDATPPNPIVSIFIISRSNCAFVNFASEELLNEAIKRFNGYVVHFDGSKSSRLVCRVRNTHQEAQSGVAGQRSKHIHAAWLKEYNRRHHTQAEAVSAASPANVHATGSEGDSLAAPASVREEADSGSQSSADVSWASTDSEMLSHPAFARRFFILKSRDVKDLDKAQRECLWSTQPHNEKVLDQAYRTSQEVILIFSANQSGAFYGYARMAGPIESANKPETILGTQKETTSSDSAHTSSTPALFPDDAVNDSPEPLEGLKATSAGVDIPDQAFMDQSVSASSPPLTVQDKRKLSATTPALDRGAQAEMLGSNDGVVRRDMAFSAVGAEGLEDAGATPSASSAAETASKSLATTAVIHNTRLESLEQTPPLSDSQSQKAHMDGAGAVKKLTTDPANRGGKGSPSHPSSAQGGQSLGSYFRIEWLQTRPLPFSAVKHLRNAWNEGRTIRVARDGTEVAIDTGVQFLDVWERHVSGSTN